MSPQIKMNEEEKAVGIGCCRICLISKVNCDNCKFAFALSTVLTEQVIEDLHNIAESAIIEIYGTTTLR